MGAYKSKVDWWLAVLLLFPIAAGAVLIAVGLRDDSSGLLWSGVASLGGFGLIMGLLVWPLSYQLGDDGLRVRAGVMKLHITWDRMGDVYKTSNPLSSPALSLKRLHIDYEKPNGKKTFVMLSPTDRDAFLAKMAELSSRHELRDDRLVVT